MYKSILPTTQKSASESLDVASASLRATCRYASSFGKSPCCRYHVGQTDYSVTGNGGNSTRVVMIEDRKMESLGIPETFCYFGGMILFIQVVQTV